MPEVAVTLGVDLGTTSAKAGAYADDGALLAVAQHAVATLHPSPGAAEQDPAAVVTAATAAVLDVAAQLANRGMVIARLGISGAMHSLIALDQNEQPLGNALIWMDQRAQTQAETLWQTQAGKALYARTGTPIHAMSPLAKLLWLRAADPQVFGQARHFVSLKEYVWHTWFGEWAVDASIASASGLFNLQQGDWDPEALQIAAITAAQLSPVVATTHTHVGLSDPRLHVAGMALDVAATIGASDGVLANLGANALDSSRLVLTIGTSTAARIGSATPLTDPATRSFCYILANPLTNSPDQPRFILGGPSNSGGGVLEWLLHNYGVSSDDATAQLYAAAAAATDPALLCLPYLAGERAPLWRADARGTVHGLTLAHTPAHVLRAAIEGILFNAYWIAEGLYALVGRPELLMTSGRVLATPWIAQLAADVFGMPVVPDTGGDASVLGAAKIARVAAGLTRWTDPWGIPPSPQIVLPAAGNPYAAKYARFRKLAALLAAPL